MTTNKSYTQKAHARKSEQHPLRVRPDAFAAELAGIVQRFPSTTAEAQRRRLLAAAALLGGSVSSIEAREALDILHPPSRMMELRKLGYNILYTWVRQITAAGHEHRARLWSFAGAAGEGL